MAPTIETSRDDRLVGTSVRNFPTPVNVFRRSGNDGSTAASRAVLSERGGGPQRSFLVGTWESTAAEPRHSNRSATHCGASSGPITICGC